MEKRWQVIGDIKENEKDQVAMRIVKKIFD
jgi:hypothetical protein